MGCYVIGHDQTIDTDKIPPGEIENCALCAKIRKHYPEHAHDVELARWQHADHTVAPEQYAGWDEL